MTTTEEAANKERVAIAKDLRGHADWDDGKTDAFDQAAAMLDEAAKVAP